VNIALICLAAALTVFIVGRWWAIAAVVGVVTVVWIVLNPHNYSFRLENGGADIGWLADLVVLLDIFLGAVLVAGAAAVGFGARIFLTSRLHTRHDASGRSGGTSH
jgi:hypothetical protein